MPACPFLWHVVPLPARYNVGCVNATSLPDLALRARARRIDARRLDARPRLLLFLSSAPARRPRWRRRPRATRARAARVAASSFPRRRTSMCTSSTRRSGRRSCRGPPAGRRSNLWRRGRRRRALTCRPVSASWGEKKRGRLRRLERVCRPVREPAGGSPHRPRCGRRRGRARPRRSRRRGLLLGGLPVPPAPAQRLPRESSALPRARDSDLAAQGIERRREHHAALPALPLHAAAAGRHAPARRSSIPSACRRIPVLHALAIHAAPAAGVESAWPAVIVPTEKDATARRPRAYPGLPAPLYTRQFTRLLAAIRRGGGDRELRRRLRDSHWALQWDGEPFATRLATERCDALCRVGAHLVEKISKS